MATALQCHTEGIRDEPGGQAWVLFVCESRRQGRRERKEDKIKRVKKQARLSIPTEGTGSRTAAQAVSDLNSQTNLKAYRNCRDHS